MSDAKANVDSYIERLEKPAGVPPFIQREVAAIMRHQQAEVERLRSNLEHYEETLCDLHYKDERIAKLEAVVDDIDRWLEAFIKAWGQNAPHKGSQAPVALMEAIRQHSLVRAALEDK